MPRMKKFADLHFFLSKKLPFLAALGMGNCFFSRKKLSAANFSTLGKIFPPYRNIYSYEFPYFIAGVAQLILKFD